MLTTDQQQYRHAEQTSVSTPNPNLCGHGVVMGSTSNAGPARRRNSLAITRVHDDLGQHDCAAEIAVQREGQIIHPHGTVLPVMSVPAQSMPTLVLLWPGGLLPALLDKAPSAWGYCGLPRAAFLHRYYDDTTISKSNPSELNHEMLPSQEQRRQPRPGLGGANIRRMLFRLVHLQNIFLHSGGSSCYLHRTLREEWR